MNVHYLQHVPFEGLGQIEHWLTDKGHPFTRTRLYEGERLPAVESFDWLIVMGGPMGVYDSDRFAWLDEEKAFIRKAIEQQKVVLGICLGAQLIADVLGARVSKNNWREIGWHQVTRTTATENSVLRALWPRAIEVFHWHGDTFELPPEAILLASSTACLNQAFVWKERVIGLQFHLETRPEDVEALLENCADELDNSRYVQSADQIRQNSSPFGASYRLLEKILGYCEARHAESLREIAGAVMKAPAADTTSFKD